jgi:hypothetical protein
MVMVFANEADARKARALLARRLDQYGLNLHPTKTRLLEYRPARRPSGTNPDSFDFLGFTHYWARSRKGSWVVKRKTAASRLRRTLKRLSAWCRKNRHKPVGWQHDRIVKALRGHYNYFEITGNSSALDRLRREACRTWRKWLNRRSQKRAMPWARFEQLLKRHPLPVPVLQAAVSSQIRRPRSRMRQFRTSGSVGGRGG